jgi:hypothetical protein
MSEYPVVVTAELGGDFLSVVFEKQRAKFPHASVCTLKKTWDFNDFIRAGWVALATNEHPAIGVDAVIVKDDRVVWLDYRSNELRMRILGLTRLAALQTRENFLKLLGAPEADEPSSAVPFLTWTGRASNARLQHVDPAPWAVVRENYPPLVAEELDEISAMAAPRDGEGSLFILAGKPGTGKSSFIKTLMRSWSQWAEFSVLLDPEEVFGSSAALLDLAEAPPISGKKRGWRVLLIEDVPPEILTGTSGASSSLSRLLNLSDGLLASGMNLITIISTNSEVSGITPALLRAGRLRKLVTFRPFLATEAAEWLKTAGVVPEGEMTLADLFEASRLGHLPVGSTQSQSFGTYL